MQAERHTIAMLFNRIFLLLLIAGAVFQPGCTTTGLWLVNGIAGSLGDFKVYKNIAYGPDALHRLDIYAPHRRQGNTTLPVIIFFYGGCWGGCSLRSKEHYQFVAEAFTAKGFITVISDYRHYPAVRFPEIIDDARRTVEWVKAHIAEYDGNDNRLFLMGHSAGAHLAALLVFNKQYLQTDTYKSLKGFIGLAGPYDFLPLTEAYQKALFAPPSNYAATQPVNFVQGNEAPALLLYGNNDETIKPRNIINLSAKIRAAGGQVTSCFYDDINHSGILAALSIPFRSHEPIYNDIILFLNKHNP